MLSTSICKFPKRILEEDPNLQFETRSNGISNEVDCKITSSEQAIGNILGCYQTRKTEEMADDG